jgi:hypothetical protein
MCAGQADTDRLLQQDGRSLHERAGKPVLAISDD